MRARQHGLHLVETLVTLALLGAGTLTTLSLMHSNLALRAADLESLRAQRLLDDAGELAALFDPTLLTGLDGSDPGCAAPCPPDELAAHLYATWLGRVAANLPGGDGSLTVADTGDELLLEARVSWTDNRGATRMRQQQFATRALP